MPHDLQVDLDVVLPDAQFDSDHCVDELIGALAATPGVTDVHIVPAAGERRAQVCLHLEPGRVSLQRLTEKVHSVGAEVSARFGHVVWPVGGVTHARRAETAGALLRRVPGVVDASVGVNGPARIEFDRDLTDPTELRRAAVAAGVDVRPSTPTVAPTAEPHEAPADDHGRDDDHDHGGRAELVVAVGAAAIYVIARILDSFSDVEGPVTAAYVVVFAVSAVFVGRDVWATARARRFDIEVLMLAAAVGAAAIGHWSDAALLLVLFSLGHSLEGFAMGRARREIESLADLAPPTARRVGPSGDVEEVPVADLAVDDVVVIRPNERIPADGIVLSGTGSVDEAPVTGESVPVEKDPIDPATAREPFEQVPRRHRVFAGTLNGSQALEIGVARVAADSTLARVVTMVTEAETLVSPTQALTGRIVRVFVPGVLVLVVALLVVPALLGHPFEEAFLRAMAVLVAASPCALAIATPSAVLAAIARAARSGVLVKGGGPLEELGRVGTIAFDKTGTLTEGRPRLVAVEAAPGTGERDLLGAALAVERLSDHPLATAITGGALQRIPDLATDEATAVEAVVGKGVRGTRAGVAIEVGNTAMFDGDAVPPALLATKEQLESQGATTMIVREDGRFLGVLGVMDTPRAEAADTVQRLATLGVRRMVMLSGDQQAVADAVASQVGVPEARGGLLPEDKVTSIRDLAQADGRGVAMVGDGVNDAPALATANVGIAMGAAGSDIALETADIALMADRLDRLPFTVALARRASRVIHQNLLFSLGVVAVLIPLTLLGVGIGPAVIAHEGSTLVVVANALALLRFRDPRRAT